MPDDTLPDFTAYQPEQQLPAGAGVTLDPAGLDAQQPDSGGDPSDTSNPDAEFGSDFGGGNWESGGQWTDATPGGDSGGTQHLLAGIASARGALVPAGFKSFSFGGPYGLNYQSSDSDTLPPQLLNKGSSALPTRVPLREPGGHMATDAIVYQASEAAGRALSAKTIVRFILRWGWELASSAFRLPPAALMQVFVHEKARPHRRRGPHLYTVLKRIRAGDRYRKMLGRYAAKAHALGRHHGRAPAAQRGQFRVMKGGKR